MSGDDIGSDKNAASHESAADDAVIDESAASVGDTAGDDAAAPAAAGDDSFGAIEITLGSRVSDVPAEEWDALLPPQGSPFMRHAFLSAMETTGCASAEEGWLPCPLLIRRKGRLVGAAAAWLKGHSYGEFVYDWAWANFAQRMGVAYYPKLIIASPFSPAGGDRLLVDPSLPAAQREAIQSGLIIGARTVAEREGFSSAGLLFPLQSEAERAAEDGWLLRTQFQFHWHNQGFDDFDAWLATFRSKRRREIRRERKLLRESGYRVEVRSAKDGDEALIDRVFSYYCSTCDRYAYGRRYLNRDFFAEIFRTMPEDIVIFEALDPHNAPIAGAFCLRDCHRLYGRYWGAVEEVPMLHFEVTCYALVEYGIREKLHVVEFGHGGEHKYRRGLLPELTHSAHWIADESLRSALANHLEYERKLVDAEMQARREQSPLKTVPETPSGR